jgi:hypothetical protein
MPNESANNSTVAVGHVWQARQVSRGRTPRRYRVVAVTPGEFCSMVDLVDVEDRSRTRRWAQTYLADLCVLAEDAPLVAPAPVVPDCNAQIGTPPTPPSDEDTAPLVRVRRPRRRTRQRSKTIAAKRLSREERRIGQLLVLPDVDRPRTRGDCEGMPRPCPFVSCKHHLYLDVNPEIGSIKLNFPDLEVWEMRETCALDVADRGGITLEDAGEILNLTRERIRQVEVRGLLKLKMEGEIDGSKDLAVLDLLASAPR